MSKSVIAVSAIVGSAAALLTCLVFFFVFIKPSQTGGIKPSPTPTQLPTSTPIAEIPNPEIKAADVRSVKIVTVYKGFFDAGNKCAKTYNEYFGNQDDSWSPSSPCEIQISFDRDGTATRIIEIKRWDKVAKEKRLVERAASTAAVTPEQFGTLAEAITSNEAFKSWREGTMLTVSNCSITVTHSGGIKTVMSNVDEKATAFLPMVQAFRDLEAKTSWRAVQ